VYIREAVRSGVFQGALIDVIAFAHVLPRTGDTCAARP
jgi:hypothetical protein